MNYKTLLPKKRLALTIISLMFISCYTVVAHPVQVRLKGGGIEHGTLMAMQSNVSALLSAINNAVEDKADSISISNNIITKECLEQIKSLWKTVPFRVDSTIIEDAYCLQQKNGNDLVGYEVRHIEITMMPRNPKDWEGNVKQEICIDFDLTGKITFFTLSMEWHSVKKMIKYGEQIDEIDQRFRKVVDFCDQLMTAYCQKDKETLSKLYDENAIIVVGREFKNNTTFTKLTGKQYLKNLTNLFSKTEQLKVKFEDYEIVQYRKGAPLYVVTFRQNWFSKERDKKPYSDCGYVCLVWDFHNESEPIIHFRSWQPIETKPKDVINRYHPELSLPIDY